MSLPNRRTNKGLAAGRCFLYGEPARVCVYRRLVNSNLIPQTDKCTFITYSQSSTLYIIYTGEGMRNTHCHHQIWSFLKKLNRLPSLIFLEKAIFSNNHAYSSLYIIEKTMIWHIVMCWWLWTWKIFCWLCKNVVMMYHVHVSILSIKNMVWTHQEWHDRNILGW